MSVITDKAAGITTTISYTASGGTTVFGLLKVNELAAIVGIVLGVMTFMLNWFYQHKRYQLAKTESARHNSNESC